MSDYLSSSAAASRWIDVPCLEDDLELRRRLGLVPVWESASEADIAVPHALLRRLPVRESHVVRLRFGLRDDGREHLLREAADEVGISVSAVWVLERRALRQLADWWPQPEVSR